MNEKNNEEIRLQPLTVDDLDLLLQWFNQPHVKQWWYLSEKEIDKEYRLNRLEKQDVFGFIVYFRDKPIAFTQYYYANSADEGWWEKETDPGTVGIDQFIADENYLGRGLGTAILKQLIYIIFANPVHKKIILDVHADNHRAIRCYEKVGFRFVETTMTPDGLANMMVLWR